MLQLTGQGASSCKQFQVSRGLWSTCRTGKARLSLRFSLTDKLQWPHAVCTWPWQVLHGWVLTLSDFRATAKAKLWKDQSTQTKWKKQAPAGGTEASGKHPFKTAWGRMFFGKITVRNYILYLYMTEIFLNIHQLFLEAKSSTNTILNYIIKINLKIISFCNFLSWILLLLVLSIAYLCFQIVVATDLTFQFNFILILMKLRYNNLQWPVFNVAKYIGIAFFFNLAATDDWA